jgi:hypothetical protein
MSEFGGNNSYHHPDDDLDSKSSVASFHASEMTHIGRKSLQLIPQILGTSWLFHGIITT